MEGARELAVVFTKPEQIGKLYLLPGSHARGKTFSVYVLPEDEDADIQYESNPPINKNIVEVFGVIGGQCGWTEYYGWIHRGKWENDLNAVFDTRKKEIEENNKKASDEKQKRVESDRLTTKELISKY